ncbi:hypothetical protein P171DRAFT_434025 [Karstenula rhodostoma CBS 690.94]|uniref:F-box domain-containing protein n=1 Tax=Karstenula rhodostoma CBS 690.94 TaxID=1392251 RepID=A0A9P4U9V7_9PLEO|nr:hypothetical protein P171DRAFT_434025 [Karstenula rhodostoma CBS 690.94]
MAIDDLSAELLLHIASHLFQVDLLNLSLTCKRLRIATEPELFRECTVVHPESGIEPFLRRVLERPDLALQVQRVQLRQWSTLSSIDWRYWKYEENGDRMVDEIDDLIEEEDEDDEMRMFGNDADQEMIMFSSDNVDEETADDYEGGFENDTIDDGADDARELADVLETGHDPLWMPEGVEDSSSGEPESESDASAYFSDDYPEEYWKYDSSEDDNLSFTQSVVDKSFNDFYNDNSPRQYWNPDNDMTDEEYDMWWEITEPEKDVRDYSIAVQRKREPDEVTYKFYTDAARAAGIISHVLEYHGQNELRQKLRSKQFCKTTFRRESGWDEYLEHLPYDQRFCMGLRAGAEEPIVVLLLALLPNLRELYLQDMVEMSGSALTFKSPEHRFKSLRRVAVREGILAAFNNMLQGANMDNFEAYWTRSSPEMAMWRRKEFAALALQPGTCNISRLSFVAGFYTYSDIKTIIRACPRLEAFRFAQDHHKDDPPSLLHLDKVLELLLPSTHIQLKELSLVMFHRIGADDDTEKQFFRLLPKFTFLQRLEISEILLFSGIPFHKRYVGRLCAAIPPSLEHLVLHPQPRSWHSTTHREATTELVNTMPPTLSQFTACIDTSLVSPPNYLALELLLENCANPAIHCRVVSERSYLEEQARSSKDTVFHGHYKFADGERDLSYYQALRYSTFWKNGRYTCERATKMPELNVETRTITLT